MGRPAFTLILLACGCAAVDLLEPLSFGPTYLEEFTERCLQLVEESKHTDVAALPADWKQYGGGPWSWGSGCSGTDSPSWAYASIKKMATRVGVHLDIRRLFSAEIELFKRKWIQGFCTPAPDYLFSDVFDLSAREVVDTLGQRVVPLQAFKG